MAANSCSYYKMLRSAFTISSEKSINNKQNKLVKQKLASSELNSATSYLSRLWKNVFARGILEIHFLSLKILNSKWIEWMVRSMKKSPLDLFAIHLLPNNIFRNSHSILFVISCEEKPAESL